MPPKVLVQDEEEEKRERMTVSKEKIAARRGTMKPMKAQVDRYKRENLKPRSTFKNVYRWWEKDSIKYA